MESGSTVDIRQVLERLEPELVYMSLIQGQLFSKQFFGVRRYVEYKPYTEIPSSELRLVRSVPILTNHLTILLGLACVVHRGKIHTIIII